MAFKCKPTSKVTSNDFFFDGPSKEGDTRGIFGSNLTAGNVLAFPGFNTLGISVNRVNFAPGGVNPLHLHPLTIETVLAISRQVLVGFVTIGNMYYSKVLTDGQIFVIPKGLVHFQMNVGP
jgi:quercetin dioxygenase-like cupin family protein